MIFLSLDPTLALGFREVAMRIGSSLLVGGMIGLNREIRKRPAGLRTHSLVTIGAAIITMTVSHNDHTHNGWNEDALSRVIQGIFTGIGFLGAGVIARDPNGMQIRGLTSAATIWVTASLGVICGLGYWRFVLLCTFAVLAILIFGSPLEKSLIELWNKLTERNKHE